ncbi:VOC family protein [Brachybacterium sp. MASK1Z-5]|uniref:Bleomycin resistance protein n=1 Tax=Brachybacterium halotolerans TaxID=2795215 RepID=A0ABS1B747_9MICO|nr:VOC family protein [Brachybacterium halotolerans]MBK0330426.1 VOC family protein [Brachybacterium halotolerans]
MDTSPALVPELMVEDLTRSLRFWVEECGFSVRYARPEEGFAYLELASAHVMLDQRGIGRDWVTGRLDPPLGRGINLQIGVPDAESLAQRLVRRGVELFLPPETRWYRMGVQEAGVVQFLVQDPDGYLLRFQSSVGKRTV